MKKFINRLLIAYLVRQGYVIKTETSVFLDKWTDGLYQLKMLRLEIESYSTQKPANVSAPDLVYSKGF